MQKHESGSALLEAVETIVGAVLFLAVLAALFGGCVIGMQHLENWLSSDRSDSDETEVAESTEGSGVEESSSEEPSLDDESVRSRWTQFEEIDHSTGRRWRVASTRSLGLPSTWAIRGSGPTAQLIIERPDGFVADMHIFLDVFGGRPWSCSDEDHPLLVGFYHGPDDEVDKRAWDCHIISNERHGEVIEIDNPAEFLDALHGAESVMVTVKMRSGRMAPFSFVGGHETGGNDS